jgi:hypothetical protein
MTNIEKFDPSKLMDGVRDRIKATFVSLIPDEQWEQLCKTEIEKFFAADKRDNYSYNWSNFQNVCQGVLTEITKEKIKEFLEKYDGKVWENNNVKPNDVLLDLLKKNAAELFASMMGRHLATALQEMRNRSY